MTVRDPLAETLDRFDVPPVPAALVDRIVAAAMPLPPVWPVPRRDRRGLWRRGRQVAIGAAAFTMLSAAAVASGWLGKVGIHVPVLTAMLAPRVEPVHKIKATVPVRLAHKAPVSSPKPPPTIATVIPSPPSFAERQAIRVERRERIAKFVDEHPRAAAIIAQRIGQRMRQREMARREMLGLPPANPNAPGFRPLMPEERFLLRRERRRDFRRMEVMLDRRIERREARQAAREGTADPQDVAASASSMVANATGSPAR